MRAVLALVLVLMAVVLVLSFVLVMDIRKQPAPAPPRGSLEDHLWTGTEMVEAQVTEFIDALEYPAEPTHVFEYKAMAVQVKESTPGKDTYWSLTFILAEDGWSLANVVRIE